jgi:hypothetical protein
LEWGVVRGDDGPRGWGWIVPFPPKYFTQASGQWNAEKKNYDHEENEGYDDPNLLMYQRHQ